MRKIGDIALRGLLGCIVPYVSLYLYVAVTQQLNPFEFVALMVVDSVQDWISVGGFGVAGMVAGIVSGLLEIRMRWLIGALALAPFHSIGYWVICGFGGASYCRTIESSLCFSIGLLVAFVVPFAFLWTRHGKPDGTSRPEGTPDDENGLHQP